MADLAAQLDFRFGTPIRHWEGNESKVGVLPELRAAAGARFDYHNNSFILGAELRGGHIYFPNTTKHGNSAGVGLFIQHTAVVHSPKVGIESIGYQLSTGPFFDSTSEGNMSIYGALDCISTSRRNGHEHSIPHFIFGAGLLFASTLNGKDEGPNEYTLMPRTFVGIEY